MSSAVVRDKILVEAFTSIRELEIELSEITLLIGPQASGKSVVAKLLYFFRELISELAAGAAGARAWAAAENSLLNRFRTYFPPRAWGTRPAKIRFETGGIFVELRSTSERMELECSPVVREAYSDIGRSQQELLARTPDDDLLQVAALRTKARLTYLKRLFGENEDFPLFQRFIPASRSFFSQLKSSFFTFGSRELPAIDPFITQFGAFYENSKESLLKLQSSEEEDVRELVERILGGRYLSLEDDDYLQLTDGRRIRIASASSGQQEALPLAIVLADLLARSGNGGGRRIVTYIEEPEAHLFPTAQRDVVDLIALAFNASRVGPQFFITTHSPYILTSFNNLLEAGQLYETLPEDRHDRLREIVSRERAIHPTSVTAYALDNGCARYIFDDEYDLIAGHEIDSVSEDLGLEFDRLLELAPEKA